MVEYVIATCAMLVVFAVMAWVVSAARHAAVRTGDLVAADCP